MKRANTNSILKEGATSVFSETIEFVVTKSRHYAIPLIVPCRIVHNRKDNDISVSFSIQSTQVKDKIAMKLHHQFVHTPCYKLIKLINSTGEKWVSDHILKDKIRIVCKNCPICFVYKKHH